MDLLPSGRKYLGPVFVNDYSQRSIISSNPFDNMIYREQHIRFGLGDFASCSHARERSFLYVSNHNNMYGALPPHPDQTISNKDCHNMDTWKFPLFSGLPSFGLKQHLSYQSYLSLFCSVVWVS